MHQLKFLHSAFLLMLASSWGIAQEHGVEVIQEPPPADALTDGFVALLADQGYRVKKGSNRTVCEVWLCKQWQLDGDFEATEDRLYPFRAGQLIGVMHFRRKGSDFRDQTLGRGWYTLRMGLQPIDGNHEGTSPTRDFLVLVQVADDAPQKSWDIEALYEASALAADSSHPALFCLQTPVQQSEASIRHDEANDWWILHVNGAGIADGQTREVALDIVVAGHAAE